MKSSRKQLAAIIAGVLLGACGGDKPNPVEPPPVGVTTGTATLTIASAPEFLGAIRLRVVGPGMSNLNVRGTARIIAQRTVADTTTLLLSVTSSAGAFINVSLADRTRTPNVVVQEATAGSLDGYRALTPSLIVVNTTIQ